MSYSTVDRLVEGNLIYSWALRQLPTGNLLSFGGSFHNSLEPVGSSSEVARYWAVSDDTTGRSTSGETYQVGASLSSAASSTKATNAAIRAGRTT